MPDTAIPYEQDWYAWTQDQAARLRAWPEHLRPNGLDVEHLAEEIEDLGGSQRRAIESYLHQLLLHLLKLEFHPDRLSRGHWIVEVSNFRGLLKREWRDSPGLRGRRDLAAADAWPGARRTCRAQLAADAPDRVAAFDAAVPRDGPLRYDLDTQVLNEDWYPERGEG